MSFLKYTPGTDEYADAAYDARYDAQMDDAMDAPTWDCDECSYRGERTPGEDLEDKTCPECGEVTYA